LITAFEQIFEQGAVEGIGLIELAWQAGPAGAVGGQRREVCSPACLPFVAPGAARGQACATDAGHPRVTGGVLNGGLLTDHPFGANTVIAAVLAERNPVTGAITDLADTFANDSSLHATPGYDDVTGVGTPTASYLNSYPAR
jgi:hypothetical protein